jgi:hypothetical protein
MAWPFYNHHKARANSAAAWSWINFPPITFWFAWGLLCWLGNEWIEWIIDCCHFCFFVPSSFLFRVYSLAPPSLNPTAKCPSNQMSRSLLLFPYPHSPHKTVPVLGWCWWDLLRGRNGEGIGNKWEWGRMLNEWLGKLGAKMRIWRRGRKEGAAAEKVGKGKRQIVWGN